MHVLFVCSGNTCRSPLAEAVLRRLLAAAGRPDITVSSAGTGAYDGAPASEGAVLVALEQGLDLTAHRARLLDRDIVAGADVILTMSRGHLSRVERLGGADRAHLLGDYAGVTGAEAEVRDPFGAEVETYRATLEQLERLLLPARDRLLPELPS
jgi:protein-tyrosine-phosphatase